MSKYVRMRVWVERVVWCGAMGSEPAEAEYVPSCPAYGSWL